MAQNWNYACAAAAGRLPVRLGRSAGRDHGPAAAGRGRRALPPGARGRLVAAGKWSGCHEGPAWSR